MKRLAFVLACLTAFACASHDASTDAARLLQPDLQLIQISGPADQGFPPGLFQVRYGVRIKNNSGEPLTLRHIELEPMGDGGPYVLRKELYNFNNTIAPGQSTEFAFWANAFSTGTFRSVDAYAPVSVRGIASFDSPAGQVRKIFLKVLAQEGARRE
jgi:hypothetical protein